MFVQAKKGTRLINAGNIFEQMNVYFKTCKTSYIFSRVLKKRRTRASLKNYIDVPCTSNPALF